MFGQAVSVSRDHVGDSAARRGCPGKTRVTCFTASFDGSLCDQCLTVHPYTSIADARAKIEAWRFDCNQRRPARLVRPILRRTSTWHGRCHGTAEAALSRYETQRHVVKVV